MPVIGRALSGGGTDVIGDVAQCNCRDHTQGVNKLAGETSGVNTLTFVTNNHLRHPQCGVGGHLHRAEVPPRESKRSKLRGSISRWVVTFVERVSFGRGP